MYRSGCLFMAIVLVVVAVFAVSLVGCDKVSMEDEKLIDFTAATAEEIPSEVLNVFEKVDSVHVSQTVDMEVTMMGHPSKITVNAESDISVAEQAIHTVGTSRSNDLSMTAEMYIEKKGENALVYFNANNTTWMKQEAPIAALKASQQYTDTYESAKYFLASLQGVERNATTHNGQAAIELKGYVDLKDPEGIIENTGMSGAGISTSQFVQMLTGLEKIDVSLCLDASTGLPLELSIDMTEFMRTAYANMGKAMGTGMDVSVGHAICTMSFSDYNAVSATVPDSVKNSI